MPAPTRLHLPIDPEHKRLIEAAAAAEHRSVTAFVLDAAVRRARAVASGPERRAPRPIGGWTFALPDGWDEAFNDIADLR